MSDYGKEWQEYGRRRKQYSLALLAFYPFFFGLVVLSELSEIVARSKLAFFLSLIYASLLFYAAVRVSRWPCPQCKQPFCSVYCVHAGRSLRSVSRAARSGSRARIPRASQ
jgi:hypothetical protein